MSSVVSPDEPEPAGDTQIPCFLHAGDETVMTVTRGGDTVEPVTTFAEDDMTFLNRAYDYYLVKPGDVITITTVGEAKGGVKAGPDVKSDCIDADGVLSHPLAITFGTLPNTYTVGEHDTYINIVNVRS